MFDLPDLPQQGGHHVRVFNNKSIDNDTDNFAPEGNIVGEVPRGSGIIVMANSDVEIFKNTISGNGTVNLAIVSYGSETEDSNYYPHPKRIQVHNNEYGRSGFEPDLSTGDLAKVLHEVSDGEMADIFWDGVLPLSQMVFGQPDDEKLKIDEQNQPNFLAMSPLKYLIGLSNPIKKDIKQYKGEIIPLPAVSLESL